MRKIALAALLLLGFHQPGMADDTSPLWSNSGEWQIRVDATLGNGCFMLAGYRQGELVRLGFDNLDRVGYLMLANPVQWQSLVVGQKYTVTLAFDGLQAPPWTGIVKVMGSGLKMITFPFNNPNFFQSFADHAVMTVYYNGRQISILPLQGTQAAINALIDCNKQFMNANDGPHDPFVKPSTDPFQQH